LAAATRLLRLLTRLLLAALLLLARLLLAAALLLLAGLRLTAATLLLAALARTRIVLLLLVRVLLVRVIHPDLLLEGSMLINPRDINV
jgi:hypothetical protein